MSLGLHTNDIKFITESGLTNNFDFSFGIHLSSLALVFQCLQIDFQSLYNFPSTNNNFTTSLSYRYTRIPKPLL
jgi:hypothetical protein